MSTRITIFALLIAFIAVDATAQNRRYRRRGVILGGLAGAAIGAAIGDKGDNETAGALIGGAVGAVAGGTIGNQKDQRIEHNYRYHSGHSRYSHAQPVYPQGSYSQHSVPYYAPRTFPQPATPIAPAAPVAPASPVEPVGQLLGPSDVLVMVQSGLSESTVIQQIRISGVLRPLTVGEVIDLHRAGVSESIINAMQTTAMNPPSQTVVLEPAAGYPNPPASPTRSSLGPSILAPGNGI